MDLSNDTIKTLISGAVRFLETDGGVTPLRFTEEQSSWYNAQGHKHKPFAASGMRLDFTTDAREVRLQYASSSGSSRKFCYFDLCRDGVLVRHCGTENWEEEPEGTLVLKNDGKPHRITIYLPNLSSVSIRKVELPGATICEPVKQAQKALIYGDSITQGYDARYPSFSYANLVADHFRWEPVNKAVGGDVCAPELGAMRDDFTPDHILVAYGTNDWSHRSREDFEANVRGFFRNLRNNYPTVLMHVLLPIWRKDHARVTQAGTFQEARECIRRVCTEISGVQIIDGFPLIPQLEEFFSDGYLHPNDVGFLRMADGVIRELEKEGVVPDFR